MPATVPEAKPPLPSASSHSRVVPRWWIASLSSFAMVSPPARGASPALDAPRARESFGEHTDNARGAPADAASVLYGGDVRRQTTPSRPARSARGDLSPDARRRRAGGSRPAPPPALRRDDAQPGRLPLRPRPARARL